MSHSITNKNSCRKHAESSAEKKRKMRGEKDDEKLARELHLQTNANPRRKSAIQRRSVADRKPTPVPKIMKPPSPVTRKRRSTPLVKKTSLANVPKKRRRASETPPAQVSTPVVTQQRRVRARTQSMSMPKKDQKLEEKVETATPPAMAAWDKM